MDYRNLLKKYIDLVQDMEGANFILYASRGSGFSPEETKELENVLKELEEEWENYRKSV